MPNTEPAAVTFDASPLRYLHTGLGQFSFQLLTAFAQLPKRDLHFVALVHPDYKSLVPAGISIEKASFIRRHAPKFIQQILFRRSQLWHMTTENTRLVGVPASVQVVLTLHGLHFLDEENDGTIKKKLAKVQQLVNRANVITAVSHFTANLASKKLDLAGKPIKVIYNGISFSNEHAKRPVWAPKGKFIFSIGTFFKRKNFQVMLPMMKCMEDLTLVLAGDYHQPYGDFMRTEISRLGLGDKVLMTGEISEGEKTWLYQEGEALVFPSLSEGFGIPVIESFYYGKPVFCGRFGSLPEVGANHAFYWDDFDPESMANLVRGKLAEETSQKKLSRKEYASRFSWDHTAKAFLDLYRGVLNKSVS